MKNEINHQYWLGILGDFALTKYQRDFFPVWWIFSFPLEPVWIRFNQYLYNEVQVMKTKLAIILTTATLLGGCASIQDSYVNPMNWFGNSASE